MQEVRQLRGAANLRAVGDVWTVAFLVDGETYAEISVADGEAIGGQMPEDPVKEAEGYRYDFIKWVSGGDTVTAETVVADGDMTVSAEFSETKVWGCGLTITS